MVRLSNEWMFLSIHQELDLEAFMVLKQRVFVVILQLAECPNIIVRHGHLRSVGGGHASQPSNRILIVSFWN